MKNDSRARGEQTIMKRKCDRLNYAIFSVDIVEKSHCTVIFEILKWRHFILSVNRIDSGTCTLCPWVNLTYINNNKNNDNLQQYWYKLLHISSSIGVPSFEIGPRSHNLPCNSLQVIIAYVRVFIALP